jgi:hypothetical protein
VYHSGIAVVTLRNLVHTIEQGTDYPMQLMVDLFEFPTTDTRDPAHYPKTAIVHSVRGRVDGDDRRD